MSREHSHKRGRPRNPENDKVTREEIASAKSSLDQVETMLKSDIEKLDKIQDLARSLAVRGVTFERSIIRMLGNARAKLASLPYTRRSILSLREEIHTTPPASAGKSLEDLLQDSDI